MEQHRERVRDENKEVKGIQLRLKKQRLDTGERNKDKDRQWGKSQQRKRQRVLGECAKVRQMLKADKQSVPPCVSSQRLNSKTAVWHKKEQNRRHERGRRKREWACVCLSLCLCACLPANVHLIEQATPALPPTTTNLTLTREVTLQRNSGVGFQHQDAQQTPPNFKLHAVKVLQTLFSITSASTALLSVTRHSSLTRPGFAFPPHLVYLLKDVSLTNDVLPHSTQVSANQVTEIFLFLNFFTTKVSYLKL